MMMPRPIFVATTAVMLAAGTAWAECPADATGSVRILANDFPALQAIAERAGACVTPTLTVTANLTTQHTDLQVPALTANPAEYTVKIGANRSITAL